MRNAPYHLHRIEQVLHRVSKVASTGWIALVLLAVTVNAVGQISYDSLTRSGAKRAWGPEQAEGTPDTHQASDAETAWASLDADNRIEWLRTDFKSAENIAEIRIRETFNPGAVSKVTAILESGEERVVWEGQDTTTTAPEDFVVLVDGDIVSKSVIIYIDTRRKPGWNEIDAVELVAKNGTRQWASRVSASSSYAEFGSIRTRSRPPTMSARLPRPPTTVRDNKLPFRLPDLVGNLVSSEDKRFQDKVVVLEIWGSWCGPCQDEIPYLVRFDEVYRKHGLEVVGLSFEHGTSREKSIKTLIDFAEAHNIDYPILYGGSTSEVGKQLPAVMNFSGFPTTILIGRDGKVREVEVGFSDHDMPKLERAIQALLGIENDLVSEAIAEERKH